MEILHSVKSSYASRTDTFPETEASEIGKKHKRDQWANKAEFLLSCIGLAVGIGNVWRFPYLAYENGGGSFLLVYTILLILVGKPLFFMELAIGQFAGVCPVDIWRCFPLARGIGYAMVIMSVIVGIYYNVVMCYTLYFIAQSFRSEVPWKNCYEWWGATDDCYLRNSVNQTNCSQMKMTTNVQTVSNGLNSTSNTSLLGLLLDSQVLASAGCKNGTQTASEQFWERYVLQLTDGISNLGVLKWDLVLSLLVCWVIVYFGLMKGIKSSGKVVYFTATFPYVILIILLVYGCTLSGASKGIKFLFVPKWDQLLEIKVWRAAAQQLLFSLSIGWGCLMMYSSYNDFRNPLYKDAIFISALDFMTSLISGVVIFSVLGHMSEEMNVNIADVARPGPGLAFITYPEALAQLPIPQLWSVLFFFMLFLLAIDSEFSYLENFFTVLFDKYPHLTPRKPLIVLLCCCIFFLLGLPCVTQGGQYVFNLMDTYGGGLAGLFVATSEIIAVMWGYGASRFGQDIEFMLGTRPGLYWYICWKYISPVVLIFVVGYGMAEHKPITYGGTPYPAWADGIGWVLMLSSVLQIPIWAIVEMWKNRMNLRMVLRPHKNWGPTDVEIRKAYITKYPFKYETYFKRSQEIMICTINEKGTLNYAMDDR